MKQRFDPCSSLVRECRLGGGGGGGSDLGQALLERYPQDQLLRCLISSPVFLLFLCPFMFKTDLEFFDSCTLRWMRQDLLMVEGLCAFCILRGRLTDGRVDVLTPLERCHPLVFVFVVVFLSLCLQSSRLGSMIVREMCSLKARVQ